MSLWMCRGVEEILFRINHMNFLRRSGLILLVMLCLCIALPSCGKSAGVDKRITLTFWSASSPGEVTWAREMVDKYSALHPEVNIRFQPIPASRSSEEILMAAVVARTTPDICANMNPVVVEQFISAGALYSIDQNSEFMKFLEQRTPSDVLVRHIYRDGHTYQIPWKCNPIMMMYNRKIFRECGVSAPRTYDEFFSVARTLREKRNDVSILAPDTTTTWWKRFYDFYALYVAASGGKTLLSPDGKTVIFDTESAVRVFSFLQKGFGEGFFPREPFPIEPFPGGRVAIVFTGPWNLAYLRDNAPADFEAGVAPIPVPAAPGDAPQYAYADTKNIGVFSTCRHPEEALQFVRFLLEEKNEARFMEICLQIVFRKDLESSPAFKKIYDANPAMKVFALQAVHTRGIDSSPAIMEVLNAISNEYIACSVLGMKEPGKAIHDAASASDKIIRQE